MPYKILHVIDRLDVGGAEKVILILLELFSNNKYLVGLLTLVDKGNMINKVNNNVKCINL